MATQSLTDKAVKQRKPATGQIEIWDTDVKGFGIRISYGGSRTYFVMGRCHHVDPKTGEQKFSQVRRKVGSTNQLTLAEAREKARNMMADLENKKDPQETETALLLEANRERRNTFRLVAEDFMATHGVKLASYAHYQAQLEKNILPRLGSLPIGEITRADIKTLIREKAKTHPIAANRTLALIRKIFNWALDEDLIEWSPATRIKPPAKEVERDRYHSDDEIRRLWLGFDKLDNSYSALFKILLLTGQRKNEVAKMKWADLEGDTWFLKNAQVKSGKGHLVPLSPLAVEIIQGIKRIEGIEHVFFSGRRGDCPPSGFSVIKRRLDRLVAEITAEEAGEDLDMKKHALAPWWIHDIRATFATGLINRKIDKHIVSKCLNHAEAGVTKRYIRHSTDPEKRHAVETWARYVALLLDAPTFAAVMAYRNAGDDDKAERDDEFNNAIKAGGGKWKNYLESVQSPGGNVAYLPPPEQRA